MPCLVSKTLDEIAELVAIMSRDAVLQNAVQEAMDRAVAVVRNGDKLLFAGNGGSAAEAQHMAAEYVSRFKFDRPGLAAIALTTDSSILTAIGNDYGYEDVFSRQIEALQQEIAETRQELHEARSAREGRRPQATEEREGGTER